MITSYELYDDVNHRLMTFTAPAGRLVEWKALPKGWSIEEFYGTVSRGEVSLEEVKRRFYEYQDRMHPESPRCDCPVCTM